MSGWEYFTGETANLSRRDLLAAMGGTSISSLTLHELSRSSHETGSLSERELKVLLAVADVVYPSQVRDSKEFIHPYTGRLSETRIIGMQRAIAGLDRLSRRRHGASVYEIAPSKRDQLLRRLGVNRVQSRPEGTLAERIRFHIVNSLLYALYTNPTGSTLFGIENPVGYPGGLQNLLRYPDDQ